MDDLSSSFSDFNDNINNDNNNNDNNDNNNGENNRKEGGGRGEGISYDDFFKGLRGVGGVVGNSDENSNFSFDIEEKNRCFDQAENDRGNNLIRNFSAKEDMNKRGMKRTSKKSYAFDAHGRTIGVYQMEVPLPPLLSFLPSSSLSPSFFLFFYFFYFFNLSYCLFIYFILFDFFFILFTINL